MYYPNPTCITPVPFKKSALRATALLSLLLCSIHSAGAADPEPVLRTDWQRHFAEAETSGVFVLRSLKTGAVSVSDLERAERGFHPASTFKIANALIALETGVIKDEHERFPWDGVTRDIAAWNRDHTLASALRYSVVPVYQIIARRIGEARMARYLRTLDYGNETADGGIDRFWLDGALRISAREQVSFLERLYRLDLPLSERAQRIVREMMLHEATPHYRLRAKTGYEPPIGWWVGWVERENDVWFFALNIDIPAESALQKRLEISKAILVAEGILPRLGKEEGG